MRRFHSNEGIKEGYPLINRYVTAISSSSMRTVAERHNLLLIITSTADKLSDDTDLSGCFLIMKHVAVHRLVEFFKK